MKCISILQPWASLVVTKDPKTGKAYKQIETRSWNTKYRGPILIHASQKGMLKWMKDLVNKWVFPKNSELLFHNGHIIGMVNVVETFPFREVWPSINKRMGLMMNERYVEFTEQEVAFGDYSRIERYGWLLSDPILFQTPIPCKGNLSIWNLPVELEGKVWEQIYAAKGQTGMVAIIYHTKEYQRKAVHYTAILGTDRANDLIRQTTQLINKLGVDSRYSIQYFAKEEYDKISELMEANFQPTLIASPGEGAVVVEPEEKSKCFEFPAFGASYPDAQCSGGYLWDLDSVEDGHYTSGGDIPCPVCNHDAYIDYLTGYEPGDPEYADEQKGILEHMKFIYQKYGNMEYVPPTQTQPITNSDPNQSMWDEFLMM